MSLIDVYRRDIGIIPMIIDMQRRGMPADSAYFRRLADEFQGEMNDIQSLVAATSGIDHINLSSPDQVGALLYDQLHLNRGVKIKRTKKGYSTDEDALNLLSKKDFRVQLIQRYRELGKLKGTYAEGLADTLDTGTDGRIHTTIRTTRTSTGRLSSAEPNLQNVPQRSVDGRRIRCGFKFPEENNTVFLSGDFCLAGNTTVITSKGIKEIRSIRVGDLVLSSKNGRDLSFQRVLRTACIENAPVVKAVMQDGSSVVCTRLHRWMDINGKFVETGNLRVGQILSHVRNSTTAKRRMPVWWIHCNRNYFYKHRLVAEAVLGKRPKGYEVDHIDGDCYNWVEGNLRYLSIFENHGQGGKRYWKEVKSKQRSDKNRLRALRHALKFTRRSYAGEGNPNFGKKKGKPVVCPSCGKEFYASPSRRQIYCDKECFVIKQRKGNHRFSHFDKSYVGFQDVYCLEVEKNNTFVLENGLVSHNSQIELRCLADQSGDQEMIRVYQADLDIHSATASRMFSVSLEEVEKDEMKYRYPAKRVNFGIPYGITGEGLYDQFIAEGLTAYTVRDCEGFITDWFKLYPQAASYIRGVHAEARRYGRVTNAYGRYRLVPEVYSSQPQIVEAGLRQAQNAPIQSMAADIMKEAMRQLVPVIREWQNAGVKIYPLLQVHDALDLECEKDDIPMVLPAVKYIMENCLRLSVPMKVDFKSGKVWGEMKKIKEGN